jgi:hypothetical protein
MQWISDFALWYDCNEHPLTAAASPRFLSYAFWGESVAMIPFIPEELLSAAVEMVCYFCTVIGLALTLFLAPRS